jgi:hypothetical protein
MEQCKKLDMEHPDKSPAPCLKKGDIVWAKNREDHPHPIVYLEKIDSYHFKACILSSQSIGGNIKMCPGHFCTKNEEGQTCEVPENANNQYLVIKFTFSKCVEWVEFINPKKVGHLTPSGIEFVEEHIPKVNTHLDKPIWDYKEA